MPGRAEIRNGGSGLTRSFSVKISIVTVCYNSATSIEDTLRSVASQAYPEIEHIIIDGHSTDGTMDIVNRHRGQLAHVLSEPDLGMYDAMNKGIRFATGDVIGFLNADDVYADSTVLAQVATAFEDPAVDACYADLVYVDKSDMTKVIRYWKSRPYEHGLFEKGWMPAHPTFFARKRIYEKYGNFDLAYRRQSDFELTLRFLAVHGIKSVYIPKVLVRMRGGGASHGMMHILEGNIEAYRACRKHALKVTPLFIAKKIMSRVPQFLHRNRFKTSL
jgi:glycosyltransferase involved in cell wall biosynthesis